LGEGFNTQVITLWCFYIVPPRTARAARGRHSTVVIVNSS
jgi:hypothetical protein